MLLLVLLPFAGCLTEPAGTATGETPRGADLTSAPIPPSESTTTPPPQPALGELLFADEFEGNDLDPAKWNVTLPESPNGERAAVSGGYLVVEKGREATDQLWVATRDAIEGDIVAEARVWISSLNPRAYSTLSTSSDVSVAFFRGSGEAQMDWNTLHGVWEAETRLAPIAAGEFYVVRHVRVDGAASLYLLDGDGANVLAHAGPRLLGDGPARLSFNLERGGSEFLLVDHVRVWRAADA